MREQENKDQVNFTVLGEKVPGEQGKQQLDVGVRITGKGLKLHIKLMSDCQS